MNPFNIKCPKSWSKNLLKRFQELEKDPDAVIAYWNSDKNGKPCNGGSLRCTPARPGLVQRAKKPFKMCGPNALHAAVNPSEWSGERAWIVALLGTKNIHDPNKMGSSKREILGEVIESDVTNLDLVEILIQDRVINYISFDSGSSCEELHFYGCTFKSLVRLMASRSYFDNCIFETMNDGEFYNCYFYSCDFSKSNLKSKNFKNCYFYRCDFPKEFRPSGTNKYSD